MKEFSVRILELHIVHLQVGIVFLLWGDDADYLKIRDETRNP